MRDAAIPGGADMPLTGHLTELRKRVMIVVIPMLLALPLALWLAPPFLDALFQPLNRLQCTVYKYGVLDGLTLLIRSALLMELVAFSPLILWELARFLWPGLYARERRGVLVAACGVGALFILGVIGYFRFAVEPLTELWFHRAQVFAPQLSATSCYDLQLICLLVCGLIAASPAGLLAWIWFRKGHQKEGNP